MIDARLLREDLASITKVLEKKGYALDRITYAELESTRKKLQSHTESLQSQRNSLAREIGKAKSQGLNCDDLLMKAEKLTTEVKKSEELNKENQLALTNFLLGIPNLPDPEVPIGSCEKDNLVIKTVGKPRLFDFPIKDHTELLAGIDSEAGAHLSGSRFAVLSGMAARYHRALAQFMLDVHTHKYGYTEYNVPLLVKPDILQGTGQLPKFADDLFFVDNHPLALIPTAEVPLTNLLNHLAQTRQYTLPFKMCAHSACFRQEAGSYGKDTKGLFRQHQFEKVELVQITHPSESDGALEEMLQHACSILDMLKLPYRVVSLCGGDLGFAAAKTYDIEVWIPSEGRYREISSCSNTRDFQSRRMQNRLKDKDGKKFYPHTLNGSGLAVGRTLIALLENHQNQDSGINLPDILQPYVDSRIS